MIPSRTRRNRTVRSPEANAPNARHTESLDIRTADGWSLRADVREPQGKPAGVVVLAHAMMARRTEFERPPGAGLSDLFVERGWRVIAFDFRGHGDSGPGAHEGGKYGYDDFVARDLPAVVAFAREQAEPTQPVVVLGHSLGGHATLAAQGTGAIHADAVVAVGATVWLPGQDPSRARWLVKRGILASFSAVSRRLGYLPARALGLGSDDEPRAYVKDFERYARTGRWVSADGRVDYMASLANIRVPVLQVVSEGDRLECVPVCGERFVASCAGPREVIRVARSDDGGPAPDHMGLVTAGRVRSVWERVEAWMRDAGTANGGTRVDPDAATN